MKSVMPESDAERARSLARGPASAKFWSAAISRQWQRVEEHLSILREAGPSVVTYNARDSDAFFLLIAVGHILRNLTRFIALTNDDRLVEANRTFESQFPDAKGLRDVLEHLDEYVLGEGKRQGEVAPDPRRALPFAVEGPDASDLVLCLGHWSVQVKRMADSAVQMAALIEDVRRERL